MHRIDGPGATVDNKFTEGNPSTSVPATQVTDDWLNDVQEELLSILAAYSITPVKGTQNQVLTAIQAAITASIPPASTDGIAGSFSNLKASATGASAAITVTADSVCVKNASNQQKVLNGVSLSVSGAANGANGLDTGSLAVSTWYYLWVIWNGTTTAGLLSLSSTAPTMPSGYTHKSRVGSIRTDASGNKYPLGFTQIGRRTRWKVTAATNVTAAPIMSSGVQGNVATPTWAAVAWAAFAPPTASLLTLSAPSGGTSGQVIVAPNNGYGGAASLTNAPPVQNVALSGQAQCSPFDFAPESANVYWASQNANGLLLSIGWEDNL